MKKEVKEVGRSEDRFLQAAEGESEKTERRSKLTIFSDILRVMQKNSGSARSTQILYGANLSHKRMMQHLNEMREKGFIEVASMKGKISYSMTKKGQDFLSEARKIKQFSEAFGIEI